MQDVSKFIALTGRVQSYAEQLDSGVSNALMPVSCSIKKYRNDIFDVIKYLSVALRGGAGICVNLDDFKARQPQVDKQYFFYLPETHPDYADLTDEQKSKFIDFNEADDSDDYFIINVADSMEGEFVDELGYTEQVSIEQSWKWFIELLETDSYIPVIDLSRLRPKGIENGKGLTSSGAVSFLTIYEAILNHINKGDLISLMQLCGQMNEVLRRGGNFKNGIVTFSLYYKHPDIIKYLNVPLADIPGSGKKGIIVDSDILQDKRLMKLVEVRVNDKSLMLEKTIYKLDFIFPDKPELNYSIYQIGVPLHLIKSKFKGELYTIKQLNSQVCKEIILGDRATCLILHINGGQIEKIEDIVPAFKEAAYLGCDLWKRWKNEVGGRASQYLSAEEDRQIGIGWIGVANMLAHFGIKYIDFIRAGEAYLNNDFYPQNKIEWKLFDAIHQGYKAAAEIGHEAGLERCITADTWIQTSDGAKQVKDLIGTPFLAKVNGELHSSTEVGFWSNGVKPVYKLTTNRGYSIKATSNHKILTPNDEWVELGNLKVGDKVVLSNQRINPKWDGYGTFELGWLLGQVLGNGCIHSRENENRKDYARVQFWGDQKSDQLERAISFVENEGLKKKPNTPVKGYTNDKHNTCYLRSVSLAEKASELGMSPGNKKITPEIEKTSSDFYKGFLQGLFDSDATVNVGREEDGGGKSISLCQSNINTLFATQRMLSRLGIESSIYTNSKIPTSTIEDRIVTGSRPLSNLVITGNNIDQYAALIGFSKQDKVEKLNKLINTRKKNPKRESFVSVVSNIEYVGEEEVYDCTIHDVHEFDANGIRVHNCFTIAPTQSCAFRYQDLDGNTVCKQINPPLDKRVRRTSHTVDNLAGFYYYGNKVETMKEFIATNGVDVVQELWELWQRLMNTTGMAHCMSFDLYREIDEEWLKDFMLRSPLVTTYYQLADKVDQSYLNKAVANTAVSDEQAFCAINNGSECAACSE